jgi:hypothetical protein
LEDIALFQYPSLKRLRISFVDFSAFGDKSVKPFPFRGLQTLLIEASDYTLEAFANIFCLARSLQVFEIKHSVRAPPFDPSDFYTLMYPCRQSLTILKLSWRGLTELTTKGMCFADFTALRYLMVAPKALFGPYYNETNLSALIRCRMPPNLKVLYLDQMVKVGSHSQRGMKHKLPVESHLLLRTILEHCRDMFQCLEYIIYSDEEVCEEPQDLCQLARKIGIKLVAVKQDYDLNPDVSWLQSK